SSFHRASDIMRDTDLMPRWLGRISYGDALAMQEDIVARKRADGWAADELLLLEHEPVYTIGRTPDQSSLRGAAHLPHPLFPISRGGQATFHGPGQLVGYPIIDLRRYEQDLHRYLRWIEDVLIDLLAGYGVLAQTRAGLTGVWVEDRKIASIGVGVKQWITMHGFALNVSGDLSAFDQIVPCGIANVTMTSIEKESGRAPSVEEVAVRAGEIIRSRRGELAKQITPANA
ncbi:MAG TPA: lipoyl(octanoyl) transferase LipB, partial [Chthoniobacterales bacterium]|nr:lipoyl(octanoyl) transferase LipB [Chthoniobacterales bacterium]